jgi:hypothetical protein
MSIPADWPQALDFFGTPLVIEPSSGRLSSDARLLPIRQLDERVSLAQAFADALEHVLGVAEEVRWAREVAERLRFRRKNRLTVGSPRGGQTAAVLFSFTSTCQRLGVEPWAYLRDVLARLPATPAGQIAGLLPDHWQAAR